MRAAELVGLGRLAFSSPSQLLAEIRQRPVLMLLTANISAQAISVLLSPVLSRMYSPREFGMLGALQAIIMICVPLTTFRYELAIPRASSERESYELLILCALVVACMTAISALVSGLARHSLDVLFASGTRQSFWYFVPICLSCVAFYEALAMEASRSKALAPLALSKINQAAFGVGGQIVFGLMGFGTFGLLLGFLINQAAGVTRLFRALVLRHRARGPVSWQELRAVAYKHRHYVTYASWSSALDASTKWALQLALSTLWDPKIGGFIFLSDRIVGRPLLLLSTSLLPVYMGDVGQALRDDPSSIPRLFRATLTKQALVSLAWTTGVVLITPLVIGPLFGPQWVAATYYVQLMSISVAPMTTLHSVVHTLQLAGRQGLQSILILGKCSAIVGSLAVCYFQHVAALPTLAVFAVVQLLFAGVTYLVFERVVAEMATRAPLVSAQNTAPSITA